MMIHLENTGLNCAQNLTAKTWPNPKRRSAGLPSGG